MTDILEKLEGEIRPIEGFDGYYITINGKIFSEKTKKEIGNYGTSKYNSVVLRRNKKRFQFYVHRIVGKCFQDICGSFFDGCHTHHIDNNSHNNNAYNLINLTKEEHLEIHNTDVKTRENRRKNATGVKFSKERRKNIANSLKGKYTNSKNPNAKPIEIYDMCDNLIAVYPCIKDACSTLGIKQCTAYRSLCCNNGVIKSKKIKLKRRTK